MSLRGNVNFDFTSKPQAKIYMNTVGSNNVVTLLAGNNINQGVFNDCIFFAGVNQSGMNMTYMCCSFLNSGNLTLNSMSGIPTIATLSNSILQGGNIIINYTDNTHNPMTIVASSCDMNGGQIQVNIAIGSALGSITLILPDSIGIAPVVTGPSSALTITSLSQSSSLVCNSGLTNVSVFSSSTPTTGQALVATSGTTATWQSVVPIATGIVTLGVGGTSTILMNPLSATARITTNIQPSQAPLGVVWVSNITLNTSFTIASTNAGDAGVNIYYQIYPN